MKQTNWILLAALSMIITSISCVSLKYISSTQYNDNTVLAIAFIIMGIIAAIYLVINSKDTKLFCKQCDLSFLGFVVLFAAILVLNNYVMNKAFKVSPNIGYSHMIINLNVILSLLAGYFLFKQNVNAKSLIGIIIALIGVFIIVN
tara:strand:+ start:660 stop:1097 length:438 start_codon:yes stop_codon:yes gene_type:complete